MHKWPRFLMRSYVPGFEEYLAEISGGVRYDPKRAVHLKDILRTSISITNVLLLSQSNHLIVIGTDHLIATRRMSTQCAES